MTSAYSDTILRPCQSEQAEPVALIGDWHVAALTLRQFVGAILRVPVTAGEPIRDAITSARST